MSLEPLPVCLKKSKNYKSNFEKKEKKNQPQDLRHTQLFQFSEDFAFKC